MARSFKYRLTTDPASIPQSGLGVNDNVRLVPGHELSGPDDRPRPPAAEAVLHYARSARIGAFPSAPVETIEDAATPEVAAVDEATAKTRPSRKKWVVAGCSASFLIHAAIFTALMVTMTVTPEEAQEEAGSMVSVVMLGDSEMDQLAMGIDNAERVEASSVPPDTVQPTETTEETVTPAEPVAPTPPEDVQPVQSSQPDTVQPTETTQATETAPETVTTTEPDVLTAETPAEPTVAQAQASTPPQEEVQPVEPPPPPPQEQAENKVEQTPPPPPTPKPEEPPVKKTPPKKKPMAERKKLVKEAEQASGSSKGRDEVNSRRGLADGTDSARSTENSESSRGNSAGGSAAVANYPGKVQTRIHRAFRPPSQYRRAGGNLSVRVRLTISSSGALASASVARSSGIPDLDQAALDGVRRAAPFPPLPPEWGKSTWSFNQEIQVTKP